MPTTFIEDSTEIGLGIMNGGVKRPAGNDSKTQLTRSSRVVARGNMAITNCSPNRSFRWAVGARHHRTLSDGYILKPGSETRRDRVLTDDELVKVWKACDLVADYGSAARLLILTVLAARKSAS